MIFITGDIHGPIDIKKLSTKNFPAGKNLTKDDYLICTGDFGLVFDVNESGGEERYWLKWLTNKPWTTLFVDGNHENFDRLYKLPEQEMFGGKVGVVNNSIFHLKRGEVYEIEGHKFLTFGGADSIDKEHRYVHISWWKEEIPSYKEMMYAIDNLKKHENTVDYILTHTAPIEIIKLLNNIIKDQYNITQNIFEGKEDDNARFLSEILKRAKFERWYFGHFHEDLTIKDNFVCQYHNIERIV